MPGTELVDANCEIVLRDSNLEDADEIRRFISFQTTLRLNEISSWQLDLQTTDFESYGIDETSGIMFKRDGELILDGPVMLIKTTLVSGVRQTTITGGSDEVMLTQRICYPVVEGPIFDTDLGGWRFGVKRTAVGISTTLVKDAEFGTPPEDADTIAADLTVASAVGFVAGNTVNVVNTNGAFHPRTILGVDLSTNVITVDMGDVVPWPAGCMVYQTSGGIVDDPAYVGYDTRTGMAENVAKELVYFNAGGGACIDQFGTRAIPFLTVAQSLGRGAQVTANSRGEVLLTQIQDVCSSGGINFSLKQVGQQLVFDCFYGNDLSANNALVFSVDGGNLKEYDFTYGPPPANFIMGAGPQTGIDKIMLPSANTTSINQYGRREAWVASGSSTTGETADQIALDMTQSNALALAQSLSNLSLSLTIQENDQVRFPRDFKLGDKVGIDIGGYLTSQIVSAISYSIPAGTGAAQGSAMTAALTKTMTKSMYEQTEVSKQLQRMLIA